MNIFCFVKRRILSLSMPSRLSEDFSESAIVSAVSEIWLEDWGGTRKRLKLDGVPRWSQKTTPDHIAVVRPDGRWMGRF